MSAQGDGFFATLTPAEIYHQLTQGPGAAPLSEAQQDLHWEASEEEDRANLIVSIGELIATGWQGEASAAAQGAALPLRDHVLANADKLDRAQDLLSRQTGSFDTAYNSVLPVPDVPRQSLEEPVPFDGDHAKEVVLYQAVAQHNMDVFRQYDGASEYNETNMPQEFHAGGRDGGDVSVRSADTIEVGAPRGGGEPFDGAPRGAGDVSGPGGGFPGGPSSAGYPGASAGPPAGSGGETGASGGVTETSGGDTRSPGGVTGSSGGVTEPSGGVTGSSGVLPSAGGQTNDYRPGLSGGSSSGGYSSPPGGPGFAGPGGVPGGADFGGGPRTGGGGGGAAAGPVVRGPGGAAGAGALAAEENTVRRGAAAAAGRGGVGPVGAPMGAGRNKDDEDAEHERKVLIEVDAEQTFGSDVLTAPPVIGDDEYED